GAVYLGDFGVARAAGNAEATQPGAGPKGKLGYMPPEQAQGRRCGPESDVFSLGRVVAEAADVGAGPALRAVIEKATADKPRDRYATASEFAAALLHACAPPSDPDQELAAWLHVHAEEALVSFTQKTTPGRSDPVPAGKALAESTSSRELTPTKLFASVPPPPRKLVKIVAMSA